MICPMREDGIYRRFSSIPDKLVGGMALMNDVPESASFFDKFYLGAEFILSEGKLIKTRPSTYEQCFPGQYTYEMGKYDQPPEKKNVREIEDNIQSDNAQVENRTEKTG